VRDSPVAQHAALDRIKAARESQVAHLAARTFINLNQDKPHAFHVHMDNTNTQPAQPTVKKLVPVLEETVAVPVGINVVGVKETATITVIVPVLICADQITAG